MFKGRLGIWIFVLILAIGGPWLYENIPVWLHTDNAVVASELNNIDMLAEMSQQKYGHFRVQTTTELPDIVFSASTEERTGYELIKNAVTSPLVLYVLHTVDNYEQGFIQSDIKPYFLRVNLHTILTAMEHNQTWADIGINKKVLEGSVTLHIPDENDWSYSTVEELFYLTLNKGDAPTEERKEELKPRVDALLAKCVKCPSIAQAITDEATQPSDQRKAFLAPEYLYLTIKGMDSNTTSNFVPIYFTKTVHLTVNAYLKTDYTDLDISHGLWDAMKSKKDFMSDTGWRVKDSTFDITKVWARLPNVA